MTAPSATHWATTAHEYDQKASRYLTVAERVKAHDEEAAELLAKEAERMARYAAHCRTTARNLRDEGVSPS